MSNSLASMIPVCTNRECSEYIKYTWIDGKKIDLVDLEPLGPEQLPDM